MFKNVVGLIVEYNPFHNGHLHHIQEIDRLFEDNIKIAVMSGDYVQRGEPSLINKLEKTKIALSQGIDIVIELPTFYSTQSAEIFAKGSVNLLNKLSCSHIVFGSESNDLDKLKRIATISLTKEFELSLREFLAEGFSYPTAFSKALFDEKLGSNDILALEYLRAIKTINSKIEAYCIKREKTGYYDDEKDNFSSATYIRKILLDSNEKKENKLNKIKNLVPEFSYKILGFSTKGQKYLNYLKKLDNFNERKILTSNRNLKEILNEEEIELFNFNELCSQIYRIKSSYINVGYPIIKKD